MSMMNGVAGMASSLSSAQLMQQYAVAMTDKAMETTETLAQGVLNMLPDQPAAPAKGQYIDVYA